MQYQLNRKNSVFFKQQSLDFKATGNSEHVQIFYMIKLAIFCPEISRNLPSKPLEETFQNMPKSTTTFWLYNDLHSTRGPFTMKMCHPLQQHCFMQIHPPKRIGKYAHDFRQILKVS